MTANRDTAPASQTYSSDAGVVLPPLVVGVGEAGAVSWDDETDVVVVGFGGAGVSAAIEAREGGAEVMAVDRFAGGGATRFSGGVVYAGGGTRIQKEAGVKDSAEEMAKYLAMEVGDAVSPGVIERYARESGDMLDWLTDHGVPFDSTFYKAKIVYPPEGYFLQYSGNEKTPSYAERAKPAARGHRTFGQGFTGIVLYDALRRAAEDAGVKVRVHSPVRRLVIDAAGKVIGVQLRSLDEAKRQEHKQAYDRVDPMKPFNAKPAAAAARAAKQIEEAHGRDVLIRARRGVVLTTGGFSHNLDMMAQNTHAVIANNVHATMRMNSLGCDGAGHRLGSSAGGENRGLSNLYVGRVMSPPSAYIHGIMVNTRGERFASEDAYNSILGGAIMRQTGGGARLILNASDFRAAVKECLFSGWATFRFFGGAALLNILFGGTRRASSISGLAKKLGMETDVLEQSVARYNANIGGEDEFGKLAESRVPIADRSYYAVNFSISNTYAFTQLFTLGGLAVDEDTGQVLTAGGTPVAGLYAAGRTAYGLCSNNYVSGLSIGECVFSGRRAGRSSARSHMAD